MDSDTAKFWENIFGGVDFGLEERTSFEGVSGLTHNLAAVGTSADGKRIAIVSPDPDPVKIQLISSDIQAKHSDKIIIPIKPAFFDTKAILLRCAQRLFELGFDPKKVSKEIEDFGKSLPVSEHGEFAERLFAILRGGPFEEIGRSLYFAQHVRGISYLENSLHLLREVVLLEAHQFIKNEMFDFAGFSSRQPYSSEILHGVCAVPLQEFSEELWTSFISKIQPDEAREVLRKFGVRQFFSPPADQVALGLIERGIGTEHQLEDIVASVPELGHPLARPELIGDDVSLDNLMDNLKRKKLIVEGEYALELTSEGRVERVAVKFRPREGIFFKILKHIPYVSSVAKDILKD